MFYSELTGISTYSTAEISIRRDTALCVTGHRSKSVIPFQENPENFEITCYTARLMLDKYISTALKKGYTTLLSGLAEGTDLWAAESMLYHKRFYTDKKLIGIMPFMKHYVGLNSKSLELLRFVERHSDLLITTCDKVNMTYGKHNTATTNPNVYRNRNYFMVENSAAVIAFLSESNPYSGTGQTVRYAKQLERPVYSFSIEDVHSIIEKSGFDKQDILNEVKNIIPPIEAPTSE